MPKKIAQKKTSATAYRHFRLHGDHPMEKVFVFVVLDLIAGLVIGILLQPYIVNFLLAHTPAY